jgi:hypothetical protein
MQKTIDSGTIAIFLSFFIVYNLTTVDRGCEPLLASPPALPLSKIYLSI